jgi:fatty acid desaturase
VDQGRTLTAGEPVLSKQEFSPWLVWEGDATHSSQREFSELCRHIKGSGLLERKSASRWLRAVIVLALLALVSAGMVVWHTSLVAQIIDGIILGFAFMQIGFLMHDVGHRQIIRAATPNRIAGLFFANLMVGVSFSWWVDKHNRHHRNPNHVDLDPDVDFAPLAFSPGQAKAKKWPWRFLVEHQAFFFPILLLGEHVNMHLQGFEYVLRGRAKYGWAEGILLVCHHIACFGIAFSILSPIPAIAFLVCSKAVAGFYAGMVFAPNHKGMLMVDSGAQVNWLRQQVLTSRNVRPSPINDFLYGGLNYQIEHHLFPFLRQDQLGAARAIVRPFCLERGMTYHETGIFQSLKEIFHHLQEVGASVRVDDPAKILNS